MRNDSFRHLVYISCLIAACQDAPAALDGETSGTAMGTSDPDDATGGPAESTTGDSSGALDMPAGEFACSRYFVQPKSGNCEEIAGMLLGQYPPVSGKLSPWPKTT